MNVFITTRNIICHCTVGVLCVGVDIKTPMRNKMACESTFTVVCTCLYEQLKLWSRNANNFFYFLANLLTWKVCVLFWSKDTVYLFSQIIWGHVEWKNVYTIPVFMSFRFISRLYKWKFAQSYKVTWLSDLNGNVLEDKSIKWRIE